MCVDRSFYYWLLQQLSRVATILELKRQEKIICKIKDVPEKIIAHVVSPISFHQVLLAFLYVPFRSKSCITQKRTNFALGQWYCSEQLRPGVYAWVNKSQQFVSPTPNGLGEWLYVNHSWNAPAEMEISAASVRWRANILRFYHFQDLKLYVTPARNRKLSRRSGASQKPQKELMNQARGIWKIVFIERKERICA